ncbi:hypothetical protein BWQ96_09090 [Gracilariopsis chorda]|uniref:Uncharacterized protein n=1 Tax=Gracilariopsis chorda TaxID=448386 RepID=A0A2V3IGG9_9FLOR|nr:hypothetical protein BWQ96_09090 [Gracilariopsis chorda]|eukprot:PXF41196.1 hypothetical protein BWQ96_09090 [Gracilariopsis chorda]
MDNVTSLYNLWLFTCDVKTELSADLFNESGILRSYCSKDEGDYDFGALGTWEDKECTVESAAGNPLFHKNLITSILHGFEEVVHRSERYCRVVLLRLGNRYKVLTHVNTLTSEGEILVTSPPGSFPFMNQQVLLSRDHLKPKSFQYQSIGIFIWCNRKYLLEYRPPADIEDIYMVWIEKFLYNYEHGTLHRDAFLRAFPPDLRDSQPPVGFFLQALFDGC